MRLVKKKKTVSSGSHLYSRDINLDKIQPLCFIQGSPVINPKEKLIHYIHSFSKHVLSGLVQVVAVLGVTQ